MVDYNDDKKGKLGKRVTGKATGKAMRKLFKKRAPMEKRIS